MTLCCCIIARPNLCVICSTVNIDPIFYLYDKLYQSFVNFELCLINLKFVLLLFNCVHPLLLGKCSRYTLDLKKTPSRIDWGFSSKQTLLIGKIKQDNFPNNKENGWKGLKHVHGHFPENNNVDKETGLRLKQNITYG